MNCPHCDERVKVLEQFYGERLKCPRCGEDFIVDPETEEAVPVGGSAAVKERGCLGRRRTDPNEEYSQEQDNEEKYGQRPRPGLVPFDNHRETGGRRGRESGVADEESEAFVERTDYEQEYRGSGRTRAGSPENWERVRSGVTVIVLGIISAVFLLILSLVVFQIFVFPIIVKQMQAGARPNPAYFKLGTEAVYILVELENLVGVGLCMAAPRKRGARTLAIAAFALLAIALLLRLIAAAVIFMDHPPAQPQAANAANGSVAASVIDGLALLLLFAHFIVFLFFLRAVALLLGRHSLATAVVANIVLVAVMIFTECLMILAAAAAGAGGAVAGGGAIAAMGIAACMIGVISLAGAILYVLNLVRIRAAISNYLAG